MTALPTIQSIQSLLNQVKSITEHYDKIAEERGDKFNVFDIIGIRNSEVKMHSAMLRNLLDIKGSHGMKDVFLNLFIKEMETVSSITNSHFSHSLDLKNSRAIAEEYAGPKDENSGGRIDLYISDAKNNAIIIENKIYAGEQENQLIRYENYNQNAPIVFLTLEGSHPHSIKNEKSEKVISDKVFCISYRYNIINWLENCQKEAVNKPLLREGIKHYINLIKILTNMTLDNDYKKEIIKTIVNHDLSTYMRITSLVNDIKYSQVNKIIDILDEIKHKYNIEVIYPKLKKLNEESIISDEQYNWFGFKDNRVFHQTGLIIYFEFDGKDYQNLWFSITFEDDGQAQDKYLDDIRKSNLQEMFTNQFGRDLNSSNLLPDQYLSEFDNLWDDDQIIKLNNGEFKKYFLELFESLYQIYTNLK